MLAALIGIAAGASAAIMGFLAGILGVTAIGAAVAG
jgi:hypothetical protein